MDASTYANIGVAAGTFSLAGVTVWLGFQTKNAVGAEQAQATATAEAVIVGREQMELTRKALETSEQQALEARRARIDAQAPRIVITLGKTTWPPLKEPPHQSQPAQVAQDDQFYMPAQASERFWFRTEMLLSNEGATTAIVHVLLSEREDQMGWEGGRPQSDLSQGQPIRRPAATSQGRYAIHPGERALLVVHTSKVVGDFVAGYEDRHQGGAAAVMHVNFIVSDHFADGIVDNTDVHIQSYALEPVAGYSGTWQLQRMSPGSDIATLYGSNVMPTRRRYKPMDLEQSHDD